METLAVSLAYAQQIFPGYPGFIPGAFIALAIAVTLNGWISKLLHIGRMLAASIIICLGVIVSATLTTGSESAFFESSNYISCDLTRISLIPLHTLLTFNESSLNIILFIPLGLVIGLLPKSTCKTLVLAFAFILPFIIEIIQFSIPEINRTCQSADVVDNLSGLGIGLILTVITRQVISRNADVILKH